MGLQRSLVTVMEKSPCSEPDLQEPAEQLFETQDHIDRERRTPQLTTSEFCVALIFLCADVWGGPKVYWFVSKAALEGLRRKRAPSLVNFHLQQMLSWQVEKFWSISGQRVPPPERLPTISSGQLVSCSDRRRCQMVRDYLTEVGLNSEQLARTIPDCWVVDAVAQFYTCIRKLRCTFQWLDFGFVCFRFFFAYFGVSAEKDYCRLPGSLAGVLSWDFEREGADSEFWNDLESLLLSWFFSRDWLEDTGSRSVFWRSKWALKMIWRRSSQHIRRLATWMQGFVTVNVCNDACHG